MKIPMNHDPSPALAAIEADTRATPQQKEIYRWLAAGSGNAVVRARAGTGKTTTILTGLQYATERRILLCAFNKSIAEELSKRLTNPKAEAKTLHGVGFAALRKFWRSLKVDADRGDQIAKKIVGDQTPLRIAGLVRRLAAISKSAKPRATEEELIELADEFNLLVSRPKGDDETWPVEIIAKYAWKAREKAREYDGKIDFDDMIYLPVVGVFDDTGSPTGPLTDPIYDLVCVDECQDMSATQIELAIGSCCGRILVVGDDKQAIYGFRGADSKSLDRLKVELDAIEYGLTVTWRCPKSHVALIQSIVPDLTAADTAIEGFIGEIGSGKLLGTVTAGCYVLSRTNALLTKACMAFLRSQIPARIQGRDIGKTLLTLIQNLSKTGDGSIPSFLAKLNAWAEKGIDAAKATGRPSAEATIEYILDQQEVLTTLAANLISVSELTARIENLFTDDKDNTKFVLCSSIHKIKGLENEDVFVLQNSFKRSGEEEDNIRYVALSRSKNRMWLVYGEEFSPEG